MSNMLVYYFLYLDKPDYIDPVSPEINFAVKFCPFVFYRIGEKVSNELVYAYYTCIRPKELRFLQLKYIDLEDNTITIPGVVSKNKKSIPVNIDVSLRVELEKLQIEKFDKEYFLLGSAQTFISQNMCSENYAYNRFKKCLEATGLLDKNYTLYSFKHLSNVRKFRAGWTLAEICSANRHGSLSETETYLKELLKFVRSDKAIPAI